MDSKILIVIAIGNDGYSCWFIFIQCSFIPPPLKRANGYDVGLDYTIVVLYKAITTVLTLLCNLKSGLQVCFHRFTTNFSE